ncbi:response regulator transcription factor [Acidimicrobiia bacterium EGI L10123]|uniref:response regulator transcription factor n=1 Tax=Salinilacustrithrix flava TaxID=2957203 RepID=UPI003D7C3602|nr:response regulator transcription factor [Acidimicrobiia bacterium EGI L10123]
MLIVEDHGLLGDSLGAALCSEGFEVLRPVTLDVETVLAEAADARPHMALLDFRLDGDATALPMIAPLRDGGASVVMVTGERDRLRLAECVEAGAIGLVDKAVSFDELLEAVRHVARLRTLLSKGERDDLLRLLREARLADGERREPFERLTAREQAVLGALMDGLSAEAIAERDFVSIATIRSQIRAILTKLGVSSQLAAVALARAAEWVPPEG